MNGKKKDDVTVVPQTPFPAPVENIEPRFLPDVRKSDLLQVAAFEKDGRILVAAGNFWEKGDVVFQLRVPGLKPDQEYTVQEKAFRRQFVPEQGKFFTGKMLADGILLHAGAMRWRLRDRPRDKDSGGNRNHCGDAQGTGTLSEGEPARRR